MLKKSITYEDFNGNKVTEDFFFHLSKAKLIELEVNTEGGYGAFLARISEEQNNKIIYGEFQRFINMAWGEKTEDGKNFIRKTETLEAVNPQAYDALVMEFFTNPTAAAVFFSALMPSGMVDEIDKAAARLAAENAAQNKAALTDGGLSQEEIDRVLAQKDPTPEEPRILTKEDMVMMDSEDLKRGLSTGQYVLKDDLPG